MTINFNAAGADRKALVNAIGRITGVSPKYLGMPTAAYQIGCLTVDKNGTLEIPENSDGKEIEKLLERLAESGFTADTGETEIFTVEIPAGDANIKNLKNLLSAKGGLIKKSLEISELPIEISEDKISFPWFKNADGGSVKAYAHFISAMCKMSKSQRRISPAEKPADNEKYAFRCFLLRLGFIGSEFKEERKILLKNLNGSSAFKAGKGAAK
ncbi:MAG: virulence protein [Ruminococcus sp.]|nr:virulence protein [Ruminococcus sp.]MCM1480411.1 hypothetical protein [Muribaculaceae bacterium]